MREDTRVRLLNPFAGIDRRALRGAWSGEAYAAPAGSPISGTGFARGIGFYKLFWVFFFTGFMGLLLETVWGVLTHGRVENRSGLIVGIVNPIYGMGGLLMTLFFSGLHRRRDLHIFAWNVLIGGISEYLFSVGAVNEVDAVLDRWYPDEAMKEVYPNLKFVR